MAATEKLEPPSTDPVETKAPTADDLASLLSEFEKATAAPAKAEPAKAAAHPYDDLLADSETKPAEGNAATPEQKPDPVWEAVKQSVDQGHVTEQLKSHLGHYGALVERMQANEIQRQAQADFESIVARGEKELKGRGLTVGEEYVKRWLLAEATIDPQLQEAFDHRYDSSQHQHRANKLINKAIGRMAESAKSQPDPAVTADVNAVAAAVRGTSTKAPQEKQPDYGAMNDRAFAEELRKQGIG